MKFQNKLENRIRMPDGSMEIETDELSFVNVDRHHSGIYECVADNGYGQVCILIHIRLRWI